MEYRAGRNAIRSTLFLMYELSRLFTEISDVEEWIRYRIGRLEEMAGKLEAVAELCRIEECYLTDYDMLLSEKSILEDGIKNDKEYLEELIGECNRLEREIRGGEGSEKN